MTRALIKGYNFLLIGEKKTLAGDMEEKIQGTYRCVEISLQNILQ